MTDYFDDPKQYKRKYVTPDFWECSGCSGKFAVTDYGDVQVNKDGEQFCDDCAEQDFDRCDNCGLLWGKENMYDKCPDCGEKLNKEK